MGKSVVGTGRVTEGKNHVMGISRLCLQQQVPAERAGCVLADGWVGVWFADLIFSHPLPYEGDVHCRRPPCWIWASRRVSRSHLSSFCLPVKSHFYIFLAGLLAGAAAKRLFHDERTGNEDCEL